MYNVFMYALLELNACGVRNDVDGGINQALANKDMYSHLAQLTYHLRSHNKPHCLSLVSMSVGTKQNDKRKEKPQKPLDLV